jgi:hypothetical protein
MQHPGIGSAGQQYRALASDETLASTTVWPPSDGSFLPSIGASTFPEQPMARESARGSEATSEKKRGFEESVM